MKIDCVFSGGGVKAFAFIGALQSLDKHELEIERVAGTSAGAIIASLIAADYTLEELIDLVDHLHLKDLLDPPLIVDHIPFMKWISLYFKLGLYKGDKLEKWLYDILHKKGINTFADIEEGHLKVIVSDLSLGKLVVIPDDLKAIYNIEPYRFSVAKAIRMSAGFPYLFMPNYLYDKGDNKSVIVDGGLLSNFPLWVFNQASSRMKRPQLGIKLSESTEDVKPMKINNALQMMKALIHTMKQAHDSRYVHLEGRDHVIFIPVKDVNTTDFTIKKEEINKLIMMGEQKTNQFLKRWPT